MFNILDSFTKSCTSDDETHQIQQKPEKTYLCHVTSVWPVLNPHMLRDVQDSIRLLSLCHSILSMESSYFWITGLLFTSLTQPTQ